MRYKSHVPSIIISDRRWNCFIPRIKPRISFLIKNCDKDMKAPGCILLTNDREMRVLNYRFRGKNKPTNVLSFPSLIPNASTSGDIVIALETLMRESCAMHRLPFEHFAHLLVHGILHLNGYDHLHVGEARQMELKEASLSRRLQFPNPWK